MLITPETTVKELGGRVLGARLSLFTVIWWVVDGVFDFRLVPRKLYCNSKFEIRKIRKEVKSK